MSTRSSVEKYITNEVQNKVSYKNLEPSFVLSRGWRNWIQEHNIIWKFTAKLSCEAARCGQTTAFRKMFPRHRWISRPNINFNMYEFRSRSKPITYGRYIYIFKTCVIYGTDWISLVNPAPPSMSQKTNLSKYRARFFSSSSVKRGRRLFEEIDFARPTR